MSKNLNYELLLDDLMEELLNEIAQLDKKIMDSKTQDFQHGLHLGLRDGMIKTIVALHIKENRTNKYKEC